MRLSVDNFIALLSGSIAAWLERHAASRIEYLKAENRALRSRLAGQKHLIVDRDTKYSACNPQLLDWRSIRCPDFIGEPCGMINLWGRRSGF